MKYADEKIIGERSGRSISPQFELECQEVICESLVTLMTQKGIYQNINMNFGQAMSLGVLPFGNEKKLDTYEDLIFEINNRPWQPISKGQGSERDIHAIPIESMPMWTKPFELYLNFYLPEIITYCKLCKTNNTFLSMISSGNNFIEDTNPQSGTYPEQLFNFYYKCSICRKSVISFLIRRQMQKITLCGRSERLKFNIDKLIPAKLENIVEDAFSAANESDVYAGFYHLRTFIEHYIKDCLEMKIDEKIKGDELTERYNRSIGSKLKSKIPSLTSIYTDLSKYMHSRKGDKDNFDNIYEKIIDHLAAVDLANKYPEE